ncbi:hypothetical protein AAH995_09350 [Pseudomonas putida]|uniref:hypothetical protein n=1 Tax=Pseudomonas TaxID=286 RepID=UPI00349E6445
MNPPICLGDPTSSGGSVLSCQLAGTRNGKPVVLQGHRLACGCHGVVSHALTVSVE